MANEMGTGPTLNYRGCRDFTSTLVRLKPGVTLDQAGTEVSALAKGLLSLIQIPIAESMLSSFPCGTNISALIKLVAVRINVLPHLHCLRLENRPVGGPACDFVRQVTGNAQSGVEYLVP